jgi:hypothetical protein
MKTGDIIFVRGHSPLSKIIRFFDKGRFSHVAIAVSETHIFEADWYTKAVIKPFHFDDFEIVDLEFTKEEMEIIVHGAIQLTGKWYDYWQIPWYIIKKLFNLKGKNRFNNPNMLICSEAVFDLLEKTNKIVSAKGLDIDVTPNQFYKIIKLIKASQSGGR